MPRISHLLFFVVFYLSLSLIDAKGQYYARDSIDNYSDRLISQLKLIDNEWQIRGTTNFDKHNPGYPLSVGFFTVNNVVLKFKLCKDHYSEICRRYMADHTPFVICVKGNPYKTAFVSTSCPAGYIAIIFEETIDDNVFTCNLFPEPIEFYDNCVHIAAFFRDINPPSPIEHSFLFIGDYKVETAIPLTRIYTSVNFGQLRKDDFKFSYILEMFVHNPNPHCGLYLTPIYGQPVMNILHQDSPKTQTKRNADDGGEEGEESNATETEEATPTSASVKAASTPSIVWVYIIIGITALISLVALPFVIRILYLELCRKNKNNPPPAAAAPVAANGSGQLAGAPADMSGKGAEMSNATDNGSKDPFVKEESKKKPQTPQKQAFIGPVRKEREPSAKKPKETKPSQETANVATARPSIVPPSYVLDDENRIPIHKRICEILPTRRRLQRGSDDMHRMAMVEEDSDKRHDYLNEAIHQAELEIDWVFNDHNTKDKKNKSPPKVDDLSHIGKRIIEARRRHIRPPIQCRKGEFRNEYLFAYDYAQVYDFALIEEYDLKARYFYFEYGLSEVKNRFEEWTKNKAIFDPCSVDPLVLQYDLALEEKQKNYNGELSQVGWDSSPIVHHAKRTKETIVPPTGTPAPPTEKGVKADK